MADPVHRLASRSGAGRPLPADWAAARRRLELGNRQFARARDLALGPGVAGPIQRPFAAVLGCADARVPIELVFGQAVNDVFVVRLAGNVLGAECLGSLDYAVEHFGPSLRLLVVLGHGQCGAVTAAVNAYLRPSRYLDVATSHPLRAIMDRLFIAVRGAVALLEGVHGPAVHQRPGYRAALVDVAVVVNAAVAAYSLQGELRARRASRVRAVYGIYDLTTRSVGRGLLRGPGLAAPPTDPAAFARRGALLARSAHVRRLLAG